MLSFQVHGFCSEVLYYTFAEAVCKFCDCFSPYTERLVAEKLCAGSEVVLTVICFQKSGRICRFLVREGLRGKAVLRFFFTVIFIFFSRLLPCTAAAWLLRCALRILGKKSSARRLFFFFLKYEFLRVLSLQCFGFCWIYTFRPGLLFCSAGSRCDKW